MSRMRLLIFQLVICYFLVLEGKVKSLADRYTYLLNAENIEWPSRSVQKIYSATGRYRASNIIPTRFQVVGIYAILAFPRLKPGVPITLGKVPLLPNSKLPDVRPYPSWDMQEEGSNEAIQNAVDLYIDEKSVLWVLDTGWVDSFVTPVMKGRPRVFGINTLTGKVLYDVDLTRFATPNSKFQYVVAENGLNRPVLYIADAEACAVVVWDVKKERGGIVPLPNPSGRSDTLYMVLLRPPKSEPLLVFSHLSYPVLFGVSCLALKQGQLGEVKNLGTKTGEMVILGTDNGSKIFFRWKGDRQVRVWDLAEDGEREKPLGTIDENRMSTHVAGGGVSLLTWSLESNFPDFVQGTVGSVGASAMLRPLVRKD